MIWSFLLLPSMFAASIVQTSFGEIEGFQHVADNGVLTHVFLGIRYGDVHGRFEKPKMVEKWEPHRHSAKHYGASCIPFSELFFVPEENSEDCLFMNIITPTIAGDNLPVFFVIHGGGFEIASSSSYGYKRLAERVASEGIVVVTINYRLGPLGFFSLGDSVSPGNMGLWDQTLALRFLHKVLPSFGGDVTRITVGGASAGSCSTSALQFSTHSNTLFSQSILLSGSTLSELSNSQAVVEESKKLAKELGCLAESTTETLSCLQERTAIQIIKAVDKLGTTRRHPNMLMYHPRVDGEFFPDAIEKLAQTAPKKRSLQGAADQEGAIFVLLEELSGLSGLVIKKSDWSKYSREHLIEFIETVVVTDQEYLEYADAFRRLLVEFYVEKDEQNDWKFYLQRYADLVADLQFLMPLYHETRIKLANDWPTFLYILHHTAKDSPRKDLPINGAFHGDESTHFTDCLGFYPIKDSDFEESGVHFVRALVNFIKNGDPSSSSFAWPPITKQTPFQHASITANFSVKREAYRAGAARLWLDTIPRSVPAELLIKTRMPGAAAHFVHTEL